MRRQSDWAASPVMAIGLAAATAMVQLSIVAQLFTDYVQSVAA